MVISTDPQDDFRSLAGVSGRTNRKLGDKEERMVFEKQVAERGFMVS